MLDLKLERARPQAAGIATGFAMAVKLYPAAALLYFIAERYWVAPRRAIITAISLGAFAAVVMRREPVEYWRRSPGFLCPRAPRRSYGSSLRMLAWTLRDASLRQFNEATRWRERPSRCAPGRRASRSAGRTISTSCCRQRSCLGSSRRSAAGCRWRRARRGALEALHPGRNAIFIVARAIALVMVVVALPIDQEEVGGVSSRAVGFYDH
jgi:hypothetical protein